MFNKLAKLGWGLERERKGADGRRTWARAWLMEVGKSKRWKQVGQNKRRWQAVTQHVCLVPVYDGINTRTHKHAVLCPLCPPHILCDACRRLPESCLWVQHACTFLRERLSLYWSLGQYTLGVAGETISQQISQNPTNPYLLLISTEFLTVFWMLN